jgi:Mg-chelatase subunit ChlD
VRQVGPADVPPPADLVAYDAVVLDDVPSGSLGAVGARALAAYVGQAGGGLLLLGGPQSLDAAGYPEGPLGSLLPVDLRPRGGRRGPAMGLVIVFDKSGSMADVADGVQKIEVARQAVKRVLDVVPATDSVGVIAFDSAPAVIAPLTASPDAAAIASRLRGLEPGGSTAIAPAMALAADWLGRAAVSRRYVLLMSDGRTPPADVDRLREAARTGGFELSVIAIGADADRGLLERLAQGTGGRAYFPDDLRELPILAAREAARAAGGGAVQEHFTLRAAAHPIAAGLDRGSMPDMGGYIVGVAKPGADAILMSHLDDPVLAGWRFGLGRAAVYTAGLNTPWSASLRAWSGFNPLWLQTVRWLSRRTTHGALQTTVVEREDGMHLVVDAVTPSGELLNLLAMRALVRDPAGREQDVTVHARAPGLYEARIEAAQPGPYLVSVSARSADGVAEVTALRGFYWSADRERRANGVDVAALTALSQPTGGRLLGPDDDPFTGPRPRAYREIWPALATVALLIFLMEIALRRRAIPWPTSRRARHATAVSQAAA